MNISVPFENTESNQEFSKFCIEETEDTNSNGETMGKLVFYQQKNKDDTLRHYTVSEYALLKGVSPFRMEFLFNSYVIFRDNSDKQEVIAALHNVNQ